MVKTDLQPSGLDSALLCGGGELTDPLGLDSTLRDWVGLFCSGQGPLGLATAVE